eukprot:290666_1
MSRLKAKQIDSSPDGRYICFDQKIGRGAYKNVFLGYDTEKGIEVAWNTVGLTAVPDREKSRIRQETDLLKCLSHPNIIEFYDVWEKPENEEIIFTTELVSSGTLKEYTRRTPDQVRLKVVKKWCRQILHAVHYLHTRSPPVLHRDLKCDNIFINGNTGDILIGDLGLSTERVGTMIQSVLGTPEFMAPELYDEKYTEMVDIYAFGMCCLELCTNEYPYQECKNTAQIFKKVSTGTKPDILSRVANTQVFKFIDLCISKQDFRLSAMDLLLHPFLAVKSSFLADRLPVRDLLHPEELSSDDDLPPPTTQTDQHLSRSTADFQFTDQPTGLGARASPGVRTPVESPAGTPPPEELQLSGTPIVAVQKADHEKANIALKLPCGDGRRRVVKFQFFFNGDTPYAIAREMCSELRLPPSEVEPIRASLQILVDQHAAAQFVNVTPEEKGKSSALDTVMSPPKPPEDESTQTPPVEPEQKAAGSTSVPPSQGVTPVDTGTPDTDRVPMQSPTLAGLSRDSTSPGYRTSDLLPDMGIIESLQNANSGAKKSPRRNHIGTPTVTSDSDRSAASSAGSSPKFEKGDKVSPFITHESLKNLSVPLLKNMIANVGGDCSTCLEKEDLINTYLEIIRKQPKRDRSRPGSPTGTSHSPPKTGGSKGTGSYAHAVDRKHTKTYAHRDRSRPSSPDDSSPMKSTAKPGGGSGKQSQVLRGDRVTIPSNRKQPPASVPTSQQPRKDRSGRTSVGVTRLSKRVSSAPTSEPNVEHILHEPLKPDFLENKPIAGLELLSEDAQESVRRLKAKHRVELEVEIEKYTKVLKDKKNQLDRQADTFQRDLLAAQSAAHSASSSPAEPATSGTSYPGNDGRIPSRSHRPVQETIILPPHASDSDPGGTGGGHTRPFPADSLGITNLELKRQKSLKDGGKFSTRTAQALKAGGKTGNIQTHQDKSAPVRAGRGRGQWKSVTGPVLSHGTRTARPASMRPATRTVASKQEAQAAEARLLSKMDMQFTGGAPRKSGPSSLPHSGRSALVSGGPTSSGGGASAPPSGPKHIKRTSMTSVREPSISPPHQPSTPTPPANGRT